MSSLVLNLPLGARVDSREPYTGVRIDEAASGKEIRSSWWASPRYRYRIVSDVLRSDSGSRQDAQQWWSMLARHFGSLDSFLFSDPDDNAVVLHGFGVGDGSTTTFQLQRSMLGAIYDVTGGPWTAFSTPRTNLLQQSAAWATAPWGADNGATAGNNQAKGPDGLLSASKLTRSALASGAIRQAVTLAASTTYTFSVWLWGLSTSTTQLAVYLGGNLSCTAQVVYGPGAVSVNSGLASVSGLGSAWTRVALTVNSGAGGVATCYVYPDSASAGSAGLQVLAWGAQMETGSIASQNIGTTSAAVTANPAYWPAYSDGFEPVWDVAPGQELFVAGVIQALGTNYSISSTGAVTFAVAPASGAALTWTGGYYRRVRLDGPPSFRRLGNGYWQAEASLISVKP